MTRTRAFRALAGFLAVWLGICLAQPMQLHLCVMHGGLAIEAGSHSAAHASHDAVSHATHHSTKDHQESQQCSCLGDCATGSAPAFLAPSRFAVAAQLVERVRVSPVAESAPIVATPFVLPFSNGPPSTSSLA